MEEFDLVYGFYNVFGQGRLKLQCETVIGHLRSPSKRNALLYCSNYGYHVSLFICEDRVMLIDSINQKTWRLSDAEVAFSIIEAQKWKDELPLYLSEDDMKKASDWRLCYCESGEGFKSLDKTISQAYQRIYELEPDSVQEVRDTDGRTYHGYELIKRMFSLKRA